MSPYCRYQVDSCPPACGGSGNTSIRRGDGLGEGVRSSSNPESLNLDMSVCFLQRAFCRCGAAVCAALLLSLRFSTVPEPRSLPAGATILTQPDHASDGESSRAPPRKLRVRMTSLFPGVFPLLHPHPSPRHLATKAKQPVIL